MLAEVRRAQPSRAGVNGAQAEIGKRAGRGKKRPAKSQILKAREKIPLYRYTLRLCKKGRLSRKLLK